MNYADSECLKVLAGLILAGLIVLFGLADASRIDQNTTMNNETPTPVMVGQ